MAKVLVTWTNDQGEVYMRGEATIDARGRVWFADDEGDLLAPDEALRSALCWAVAVEKRGVRDAGIDR